MTHAHRKWAIFFAMKTHLLIVAASLLALHTSATAGESADYTAHEWGTFTSVQGADGVQLDWNPLLLTELPAFVYDRNRPLKNGKQPVDFLAAKAAVSIAKQRLETPVIYFYSKKERVVDVSVKFPEGSVTEWYPQQNPLPKKIVRAGEPAARWEKLRILANGAKTAAFPSDARGSHYFAARETDANAVQIAPSGGAAETEKFLFYRGVGSFEAPLRVSSDGADAQTLHLANTGVEPLGSLFVYEVRNSVARLGVIPALASGTPQTFSFPENSEAAPLAKIRIELAAKMQRALVAAGLYEREAAAMVKTWDDAWFAEPGLRVLYVLPRKWADRVLPLTLDPAPREVARVMVGRAEILTPAKEKALTLEIERYRAGDEVARAVAVENARSLGLGRFAEPAVRRLCKADPQNRDFSNAAWQLLYAAFAPKPEIPATASR